MKIIGFIGKCLLVSITLSICLLLTVSCTTSPATIPGANGEESTPIPAPEPGTTSVVDRVDVVYFHRTNRCYSCIYAETGILYTLETYFEKELSSGKLAFKSVDVQDASNAAIIKKYDAYTSQLFINAVTGDTEHIEHVSEIWQLIGNDEAFCNVVRTKIEKALEGAG